MTMISNIRQSGFHATLHPSARGGACLNIFWDGKTSHLTWSGTAEDGSLTAQEQLMQGQILFLLHQDYLMTPTQECGRLENLTFKPGDALRCLQPWSFYFTKGKLYPVHADGKIRFDDGTPVERSDSFFAVIEAKDLGAADTVAPKISQKRQWKLDEVVLKSIVAGLFGLTGLAIVLTMLASLG